MRKENLGAKINFLISKKTKKLKRNNIGEISFL